MSEHVLKEFETLREAIEFIKNELKKTDAERTEAREISLKINPSRVLESMEEDNWNDELFLLYSIDDGPFFVFGSDYDIERWLESDAWDNWGLWELNDIEGSLNEDVIIWNFHRDICKEKWEILYRNSKPYINGWSRQRKEIAFEAVPSFSLN
ncbi:hypothetical protein FO510_07435 [Bacillus pumilus]|uniref:hypothetical protein n=1 Tax=Bacillus pumilus TaxID=1408 RepID=UPI00017A643C|nr:hypothetical protein [Bacillus pumilus]EDW20745.1 hypothetical protein BAT_1589 [Bacillus pumilus ATCC 7061]MCR4353416.1 hypothetical protein [Bacillus pumilus]MCY7505148.1 hypothetical protein [Bacillus pumilus]MDR4269485.1 hypothetical protein [Bacillus pumilus]MED4725708.1 hypothetical protein [Bacillus pumilus]